MTYEIRNQESHLQKWRGIDAEQSRELEETVEFLEEQIESLRQGLRHKSYELQAIKQELRYTNYKLCAVISSKLLTVDKAEELAKNLLTGEKPTKDVLVELIRAICSY